MKQSAVEFAVNRLANLIPSGNQILIRAILIEAKEMEKQQIIDARVKKPLESEWLEAEQYYNEQFKNK
jgi:hypothetical protein